MNIFVSCYEVTGLLPQKHPFHRGKELIMKNHRECSSAAGIVLLSVFSMVFSLDVVPDNREAWTEQGVVVEKGADGSWEENGNQGVILTDVRKVGGMYYLFYVGAEKGCGWGGPENSAIGLSTSSDGIHFTKHPGNPVIRAEDAVFVTSWEHGVRTATFVHNGSHWLGFVAMDHSGNKTPGSKPKSEWACDVGVDATIFAFMSDDGVEWSLQGEVEGVHNQGEMQAASIEYLDGMYYFWLQQASPNMMQAASKGSDYMDFTWQGWIEDLHFGWSEVEAFIHDDDETVTLIFWPFGGHNHPGVGEDVYFATTDINSMTEIRDKRVVYDDIGRHIRHSLVKDTEAGEWKWYYSDYNDNPNTIRVRTAPLQDNTATSAPSSLVASGNSAGAYTVTRSCGRVTVSGLPPMRNIALHLVDVSGRILATTVSTGSSATFRVSSSAVGSVAVVLLRNGTRYSKRKVFIE